MLEDQEIKVLISNIVKDLRGLHKGWGPAWTKISLARVDLEI